MRFLCGARFAGIFLLFLFLGERVYAQDTYLLNDPATNHQLDSHTEIFIDSTDAIPVEQIISSEFQSHFNLSKGNLIFGYLKSTIWLKVKVRNSLPATQWYLEIPAPFLEYVDFYQSKDDHQWQHNESGYYRPQSVRAVSHTGHVLPLQFGIDSLSTVYIRITGLSPKTFPIYIIEKEKFAEKVRWEDVGYGVFFGILIVMFFYNLFIYFSLNQVNYLLYIFTIVCTFLIFSAASGYAGKFLWPEMPRLNYYAGRLSLGVLTTVLSIFTIRFLEVRKYSTIMYYILLSLIPLSVVAIILVVTKGMSSAGNNLISLSTVIYMTTGIVCRAKGNKTATYFIAAWTIYLTGGLLLTLRNSGVFPFNFWTTHFVEIGAALETIIIAFALGDRYRRYKLEKEEAQALALKLQLETTEKLEVKVKERTVQLSEAYEELRQQTRIIEDKNAELDAFFYRISHDLRGPISSLLGLSFIAKNEVKEERALDYIDKQHQQAERLNNIITGLINLTKLNHTELRKEKIDFNRMTDECIASLHGLPKFPNITFKKEIQPEIEFYSEWTLLNAILQNLIENAIKYSQPQAPYVYISVSTEQDLIKIEVADNGQGIPQEYQSKIFEMFYRATQNANGTGLGLYILKRSVDRLNGTIDIKSEVGVGSTFTVKLPINSKELN